ncbi:MAG: glycosyltransferase [Geopsychrobacter sp.]|nr:glycosyltransferase [Geopsychrobacter sp.]
MNRKPGRPRTASTKAIKDIRRATRKQYSAEIDGVRDVTRKMSDENSVLARPLEEKFLKKRILLFSYAFPPIQTQMTPVVVKPMAALVRQGYHVNVLCADPFSVYIGRDESLLPYVEQNFKNVIRLQPHNNLISKLRIQLKVLSALPDLMGVLHNQAFNTLMQMDLDQYDAIITWSPFHSINSVMQKLKQYRPEICWIAQFSDPWADNPLVKRWFTRFWSNWQEPKAIAAADFIIHSSKYSRDLMTKKYGAQFYAKTDVIPHPYDDAIFPQRPKATNKRITLRYVGVLFAQRSPESLFRALNKLLIRRPDLRDALHIELVGRVPSDMLETEAACSLPDGMVTSVSNVSYVESLEKMYDSDILLLIEANVKQNLFVPSKLSDYMGTGRPIVGLAPPGASKDILDSLACWQAHPNDIEGIASAIEEAVDYVASGTSEPWCNEEFRMSYSVDQVVERFKSILHKVDVA